MEDYIDYGLMDISIEIFAFTLSSLLNYFECHNAMR